MRPISAALARMLRTVPSAARHMVEAKIITGVLGNSSAQRDDQWDDASSPSPITTDFEIGEDQGLRLVRTPATTLESLTSDTNFTNLGQPPVDVAVVIWGGVQPNDIELTEVRARLHPQVNGGNPMTVAQWGLQLYAYRGPLTEEPFDEFTLDLVPLTPVLLIPATGSSEADYTWDLSAIRPRPKMVGDPRPNNLGWDSPTTLAMIFAFQVDGSVADNVAWLMDSSPTSVTTSNNTLTHASLLERADGVLTVDTHTDFTPRMRFQTPTYTTATITFLGSPFGVQSGSTPVEFVIEGQLPPGTSFSADVRNDADTDWVPVVDGQTSDDLGLTNTRVLWPMRIELATNAAGTLTPVLRRFGVRGRVARTDLSDVVTIEGGGVTVDPISRKPSIDPMIVRALRQDGQPIPDFASRVEETFGDNHLNDISIAVYWGHPDLPREDWMLYDEYLVEDTIPNEVTFDILCYPATALVKALIPPVTGGAGAREQEVIEIANVSEAVAYSTLLNTHIELPVKHQGPRVTSTNHTMTRVIDQVVEAKDELDAVSFLVRGCTIPTMGQLHFKKLIEDKAIVAFFGREDIALAQPVPGFRYRIPEFQVDWDYNVATREFEAVQYAVHAEGLLNLGKGRIDAPRSLDEINSAIPRWIDNETLANEVAADIARTLGTGLILWQFTSTYRYPELEIGDKVALETRQFVAKDPNSGRVLKGQLYAVATLVAMHPNGRQFAGWVQGFGDILTAAEAVTRLGFEPQFRARVYHSTTQAFTWGSFEDTRHDLVFNSEEYDRGNFHSTTSDTDQLVIPRGGDYHVSAFFRWTGLDSGTPEFDNLLMGITLNNGASMIRYHVIEADPAGPPEPFGTVEISLTRPFVAGDVLRLAVRAATPVDGEAAITFSGTIDGTSLEVIYLGR